MAIMSGKATGSAAFIVFWTLVILASAYFALEAVLGIVFREPGDVTPSRALWLALHAATALPLLAIAPLQFIASLRRARPAVHRWLGRFFLGASVLGAGSAVYLAFEFPLEGSRLPLVLFGILWGAFAVIAWIAAAKGDFDTHRAFVIRTFALAFAFVWVRALRVAEDPLLFFISDEVMQDVTREWLSFVVPLIIVEVWLSWWPAARRAISRPWR